MRARKAGEAAKAPEKRAAMPGTRAARPAAARGEARIRKLRAIKDRVFRFSETSISAVASMQLLPVKSPAEGYELMACATVPNVEGLRRQMPNGWYLAHIGTRRGDRAMFPVWFVTLKCEDDTRINVTVSKRAVLAAVIVAAMIEAEIKDIEIKEAKR